jgi:hypothetical protein
LALRYFNANQACRHAQAPHASPEHEAPVALVNTVELIRMTPSRQLVPPDTSFGFTSEDVSPAGYHFYFFVLIPTSVGSGKLAQEGSNFARQRTSTIFFVAVRQFAFLLTAVG